jgi:hypothetical protein
MSALDMADLQRRVKENVAALYAGEELPHKFTEEESLALRPKRSHGFGVQPDGQILHCGNALEDMTDLEIDLWNDEMRIEAGFPPINSPEERKQMRAEAHLQRKAQEASDRQSFRVRVVLLAIALAALWWFFVR